VIALRPIRAAQGCVRPYESPGISASALHGTFLSAQPYVASQRPRRRIRNGSHLSHRSDRRDHVHPVVFGASLMAALLWDMQPPAAAGFIGWALSSRSNHRSPSSGLDSFNVTKGWETDVAEHRSRGAGARAQSNATSCEAILDFIEIHSPRYVYRSRKRRFI
jgi:hypothetical protein